MHELAVTQQLLEIALRHADEAGAARITHLDLLIGDLTSIIDDSVAFYWDIISQGTAAQGATLSFERIPASARCADCHQENVLAAGELACPHCGSTHITICGGIEFLLRSIEVELPEALPVS